MKFEDIVKLISEKFTQAWNDWDLDRLFNFLTADVRLQSPKVSQVYPENTTNTIDGRENVITYWNLLAQQQGKFKVVQYDIFKTDNKVTTLNRIEDSNILIKETYIMDEYGKIKELTYEYSQSCN